MPKLIINSTGDQYFLPDSWQFYFDQLVGEKHLSYVPNTDHSLEDSDAVERVGAFCQLCLTGRPRPEYSWQCTADGRIEVECVTRPRAVRLWQAHNPQARDFRLETIGKAYTSTPLREMGPGQYVAEPPEIDEGFAAYFVEMEFPNDAGLPVKLTTGVRVTPDVLPFANELPEGLQPGPAASID